ncbi:hypothetical protein KKH38_04915 [Patescibacteria group bacterium]|nr:hypothetical protein [Patescibacteria group bacterium]MBU4601243.1 hypothetical protein [Patescibacteria group bacterium]MCG2697498.1 hypothetical protein [Candidatus Parcubacteria bacterium]
MMKKIKILLTKIRQHWIAIVFAFIIGFLAMLPVLRSINNLGFSSFKGVYPILIDDEEHYLARTKDIVDGHSKLGNAYLAEHKNDPYMAPPLSEWLLAQAAIFFHLPVATLFFYLDFILPFCGLILFYFLLYGIIKQKRIVAIFVFLFFILFLREANRPIIQQLVFLPFFLGVWAVWKTYITANKKSYSYSSLVSIFFGILLYISPYFWTTLVVLYFLTLGAVFLTQRDIKFIFKSGAIFISGALLFSLPYLVNLSWATTNIFFAESSIRMGMLSTHWPACYFNVSFAFFALLLLFGTRKIITKERFIFALVCLSTIVIINWQNVITGKYLLFSSHYFPPTIILIFISLVIIIASARDSKINGLALSKNTKRIVIVGSLALIALIANLQFGGTKLALTVSANEERMAELQSLSVIFDWFNQNTAEDSVIYFLGDDPYAYSALYPIYTHNNIYSGGCDVCFLLSNEELLDRAIRHNIFNDAFTEQFIRENRFGPLVLYYISVYQNKQVRNKIISVLTKENKKIGDIYPPEYIDWVIGKYREVKKEDVKTALKKYQLDYIILNTKIDISGEMVEKIEKYDFILPLIKLGDVIVYQVL